MAWCRARWVSTSTTVSKKPLPVASPGASAIQPVCEALEAVPGSASGAAEVLGRSTLKSWRLRTQPPRKLFRRFGRSCQSSPLMMESPRIWERSEEHTSELQSPYDLVCRLLLEKKKK